jgi:hypothetical protein
VTPPPARNTGLIRVRFGVSGRLRLLKLPGIMHPVKKKFTSCKTKTRLFGETEGKRIDRETGKKNNKIEREKKIRGNDSYKTM